MRYKRALVLLVDGARPDVLNEEMRRGNMPHLARLCESGTNQTMLTCFPSTTGPAYLPYLTGSYPGTCNIPGIRWFDKINYATNGWGLKSFRSYCGLETALFDRDMEPRVATTWDIFAGGLSINNGVTKGIKRKNNLTFGSRIWNYYYAHLTDRWRYIDEISSQKLEQAIKGDFEFIFAVFPGVDELSHRSSPFHPRVRQAYADVDGIVGRAVQTLKDQELYDETLIVLVSDHGLSETRGHFDIGPWLETEKKIRTLYYTNIFKFKFDAVSMVSGNGMSHLYFKGQKGWGYRKTFEEISHESIILDELRFNDAVDLVVTRGVDEAIHLQTARGHGVYRFDEAHDQIIYKYDKTDPLGIFNEGTEAQIFTGAEGLERTFNSDYPDVFVQMHQLFKSRRTGDVIVSAKIGYDLREKFEHPIHKASHGSIHREHMHVPLIMNHRIDKKYVRSVDVFPTILKLLGRDIPQGIDGLAVGVSGAEGK